MSALEAPPSALATRARAALEAGSPLASRLENFRQRPVQQDMASYVGEAVDAGSTLLLEAGTGTGKTMAYLLPALLSGKRTVISTGTKHLQDQLYERDLPRALAALGLPVRSALLKGRANYLCRYRLKTAADQASGGDAARVLSLRQFMESSERGELSEYGRLADDDPLRPRVASTADNCLGSRCPDFDDCFVFRARRRALDADIVVVNHHLLFADFTIREAGFSELLPGAEVVVIDEAHQLPELAANAFGRRLSTRQLNEWLRDLGRWPGVRGIVDADDSIRSTGAAVGALEAILSDIDGRISWDRFTAMAGANDALDGLDRRLDALGVAIDASGTLDEEGRRLSERARDHRHLLAALRAGRMALQTTDADAPDAATASGDDTLIRWAERTGQGGALCAAPADVSTPYARATAGHPGAWVYVSATLSVAGDFSLFQRQLGLPSETRAVVLPQVFDYPEQARLWIPPGLPKPGGSDHTHALIDAVLPVIRAAGGGAFLLMTTHRAVRMAADILRADGHFRLFVQNEDDRGRLLRDFAACSDGILIGAASFWEGVDVPGAALRIVVIDKLPFAPPDDPVIAARRQAVEDAGGNGFMDYQLPQAVLSLRQGVGRLIRSESDRGLLILGDPRIRDARYGRRVIKALPDMPLLSDTAAVLEFARTLHPESAPADCA